MKPRTAPSWSFLALEPQAKKAKKLAPKEFQTLVSKRSSLNQRRLAFWSLFSSVESEVVAPKSSPSTRQHTAIQLFYALISLSDWNQMPDRDLQRWQNAIVGAGTPVSSHAVVQRRTPTQIPA